MTRCRMGVVEKLLSRVATTLRDDADAEEFRFYEDSRQREASYIQAETLRRVAEAIDEVLEEKPDDND